ncbi:MAG: protein kinase [Myxococcales bacterium]|nr:protein kinase [Myxococcales bacterium]
MTTSRAPTSPDLLIGRTVGTHYVVTQVLARGQRSATYLAEHRSLHRQVVLKLLDVEWAGDSDAANRFEQAARSLSTLEAPNIAALIDFGRDPGRGVFVVAELVEGESLADFVARKGSLSLDEFVPIAAQLLKGLGAAHLRGLLHLDLKPANVRICVDDGDTTRGFTRILDLGLVQLVEGHVQGTEAPVVGDPRYLAPEQISSKPVDTRTDVYALGAIFYELLAGRPPFVGADAQVVYSQVNDPPPRLADLVGDEELPEELIELIEDCLRKDPDDRPVDANEIVERLIDCVPAALFRVPVPPPKLEAEGADEAAAPVAAAGVVAAAEDEEEEPEVPSAAASAHARLAAPVLEENITETHDDPNEDSSVRGAAPAIGDLSIKEPPTASSSWAVNEAPERPAPPEEEKKGGGNGFLIFLVLVAAVVGGIYFFKPELLGLGPPPQPQPPITQQPPTQPPQVPVAPEATDVATLLARAKQLEADGDEVAALAAYHQILATDPEHAEANARLAALKGDADAGNAPPTGEAPSEAATTTAAAEVAAATTSGGDEDATSSGGEGESTGEEAAPPPVAGGVAVEFTVKPKATLFVDGKRAGTVPGTVSLPPGQHTLKIEAPRYKSWEEKVEIKAGMAPIDVSLKRKPRDLSGENVDIDPAEEGPMTQFKFKK